MAWVGSIATVGLGKGMGGTGVRLLGSGIELPSNVSSLRLDQGFVSVQERGTRGYRRVGGGKGGK